MPRKKIIPDTVVFATVLRLLAEHGDKAVAFRPVARATGLAAPTLVQRFGSVDGMIRAALIDGWDRLDRATDTAAQHAELSEKGAHRLLKALGPEAADLALLATGFRHATLRDRAAAWRQGVEHALALRLGGGAKGQEAAALLFALWQGQLLWQAAGGRAFRLKDAVRRLT